MATPKELLDELLRDCKSSDDLLGKNGVLKQLTKDLDELPPLGGKNLPQQLGCGEANMRLLFGLPPLHRPRHVGKRLVERAHLKNDRVHDSTSRCRL